MLPALAAPSLGAAAHLPRRHGQRHVNAPGSPTAASMPPVQAGTRARHTARPRLGSTLSSSLVPICAGERWEAAERVCPGKVSPLGLPNREAMGFLRLLAIVPPSRVAAHVVCGQGGWAPELTGCWQMGAAEDAQGHQALITNCSRASHGAPPGSPPRLGHAAAGRPAGCPEL